MTKAPFTRFFFLSLFICSPIILPAQEEGIAEAVAEAAPASTEAAVPTARPITVAVSLVDDSTIITGTLTETTSISIKTAFGMAELPLGEVAGVRFPRGDDTATTVVMLNGDSISGATDVKFANVETSWGNAKINGQAIASMLMVPGLTWQSADVLGSKRWQLIEAPRAQLPQASSNLAPPGGTIPSTTPRTSNQPGQPNQAQPRPNTQPIRINN